MSRIRLFVVAIAFTIVALGLAPPARGEAGLTLEEAVKTARARNERTRTAEQATEAARARTARARAFFFPDLTATGTYTRRAHATERQLEGSTVTIQSRNAFAATVSAMLTVLDARAFPLVRQARREEAAARLDEAEEKRLLGFEVADAFLQALGQEQVVGAAERRLALARSSLADAKARFEASLTGSNDVTRAELEAATAERDLADAKGGLSTSYLQLGNLLDAPVTGPLAAPVRFLERAAGPLAPGERDLVAQAISQRLDVAADRERAAAAHAAADEPSMRAIPSLGLLGQYRATNEAGFSGRQTDWFASLTLTWNLWDGGERRAEGRERSALAKIADLAVLARKRRVDLEVRDALVAMGTKQASVVQAEAATRAAQRNADETSTLYREGLARAIEVIDANVQLFAAEVALARARYGLGLAYLGLRAARGQEPLGEEP